MPSQFRFFDTQACTACGTCLERCRYVPLFGENAKQARQRIREGEADSTVLTHCTSCYACDAYCPEGLRPYESILEFWHERYENTGLPERARFLMPSANPNFRTVMVDRMDAEERRCVDRWRDFPETMKGTVLYPGCNLMTLPHLTWNPWMEGIAIHGDFGLCCGEMCFRMGLFSEVDRIAERLTEFYERHEIEEMLFVCPACYNMFTNVLPGQFGAKFAFRTRFLTDVLLERLESGEIAPKRKLGMQAAVHDSCHARVMGDDFLDAQRALLRHLGVDPVETVADRKAGHCCGIAAGCSNQSPVDIAKTALGALEAGRRSKAKELVNYCGGCHLVLSTSALAHPCAPEVLHLLEVVRLATGLPLRNWSTVRARQGLAGVLRYAMPSVLSRKRFRVP